MQIGRTILVLPPRPVGTYPLLTPPLSGESNLPEGGELITRHHRMGFPQEMGTQHDRMIAFLHFDTPAVVGMTDEEKMQRIVTHAVACP